MRCDCSSSALQVRPRFTVNAANATAIAQICHDLDGIPLAIELAAAWVRMLAPEQIARALSDRLHLLTGGRPTAMQRHETLESSIDWSYQLLSGGEQALLRRLSVFSGGWTLDAAEVVCGGGIEPGAVLHLLTGLVDKSLVTTEEQPGEMRYGLLGTVRHYAAQRLTEAGEQEAVRDGHLAYFLGFAEQAEPDVLRAGRDDPTLQRLARRSRICVAIERGCDEPRCWVAAGGGVASLLVLHRPLCARVKPRYARALDTGEEEPTALGGAVCCRAHLGLYAGAYLYVPGWAGGDADR